VLNVVSALTKNILERADSRGPRRISSDGQDDTQRMTVQFNTSCPICFSEFSDADEVVGMPCDERHFFHKTCIDNWLELSQICPICRANIVDLIAARSGGSNPPVNIISNRHPGAVALAHQHP